MSSRTHTVLPWAVRRTKPWRLNTPLASFHKMSPARVKLDFEPPPPLRPERLIPQDLNPSRKPARRRAGHLLPRRRTTSVLTPRGRAHQRGRRRRA
ncbi:hypothetical protein [Actinomadura fibrosa]|uniref:hypothetical protein n=1 Tax=Actinomadura fibrosa TaxID=111802 RepID=UPI001041B273|nr:hypothetical protein [Actinomadura fibrosa]